MCSKYRHHSVLNIWHIAGAHVITYRERECLLWPPLTFAISTPLQKIESNAPNCLWRHCEVRSFWNVNDQTMWFKFLVGCDYPYLHLTVKIVSGVLITHGTNSSINPHHSCSCVSIWTLCYTHFLWSNLQEEVTKTNPTKNFKVVNISVSLTLKLHRGQLKRPIFI